MQQIQLIGAWYSGTARDIALVAQRLEAFGYGAKQTVLSDFRLRARALRKARELIFRTAGLDRLRRPRYPVSIFFQQPLPWWLPNAAVNCVIPNQEWFSEYGLRLLPRIDEVWCKTLAAERIFTSLGCKCRYIGFTSEDRFLPECGPERDYNRFLHVGGVSDWKGTRILVGTWLRHPEWPHLTVTTRIRMEMLPRTLPPNLRIITGYIPDAEIRRLQNICGMNIQPTEMEGFGHTIVEAMSAKAVVITTDGEPMSEIVTHRRGFHIQPSRADRHHQGTRYFVSRANIENAMAAVERTDLRQRAALGDCAREWFLENDRRFSIRLEEAITAHAGSSTATKLQRSSAQPRPR